MKFKPALIESRDLNEAYYQLLSKCYIDGIEYVIKEGSNKGDKRLELSMASGFIHYPQTRPLAPVMPEGVDPTTTENKIQNYFVNDLMNPEIDPKENVHYKYSTWIAGKLVHPVTGNLISQLDWCIDHFKNKGYGNNHCYITVGDPYVNFNYDIPYTNENERVTSPCLRGLDIKIKDKQVILGVIYRSWDLFAAFPQNMGGFLLLSEYIANELSICSGPLGYTCFGLHCYSYEIESVKGYLRKE